MRKKLIAANWKMEKTIAEANTFVERLKVLAPDRARYELVLFPPFFAVPSVARGLEGTAAGVGAQDLFWQKKGAFTGEVSGEMVIEAGGTHVIIGHSERRHVIGETNEIVAKKLAAAVEVGLVPVLCVGEKIAEREAGSADAVVEEQLANALAEISLSDVKRIIIAYEPVWAIGTGKTATPEDAVVMHRFIRHHVNDRFGADLAGNLRILYGGSVKPANAKSLLQEEEIDGALVGGASLEVESFLQIAEAAP